ncbi:ACR3 family arsenite efflux pump ArsB [Geomicrobium halophilum]|uniref:ACR3 family arsenite efflux pump ArsB n=1 Tax=Geomicrobium halophilum TaxID=549000 RepID=A0A841Q177_9BACL|nr:bile acid:sodium symporter [Geomicrobium halophilum]MBB6451375.1 ACR3 family arsenite efflux pump ArsB [Geomicrobium halophilum]
MNILEKFQTVIILIAVGAGLLLGQFTLFEQNAEFFIIPFLLLMLYGLFLAIPLKDFKDAFKNIRFLNTSTIINFVWTPLLAWGLGAIFLADYPALWLGFIMFMVTPCTDWYLVFTKIAKGNMSLSTSVLPINLILQMLLIPMYLFIFVGTMESVSLSTVTKSVVLVLVIPFAMAQLSRYLLKNKRTFLNDKLIPFFSSAQILFLALAITAMFASEGSYLINNLEIILILLIPVLLFFAINFVVAQTVGKALKFSYEDTVSLSLTVIARNSPIALAIVIAAFPDQPLIALVLVIGPLIELPILAIVSQILLSLRGNTRK